MFSLEAAIDAVKSDDLKQSGIILEGKEIDVTAIKKLTEFFLLHPNGYINSIFIRKHNIDKKGFWDCTINLIKSSGITEFRCTPIPLSPLEKSAYCELAQSCTDENSKNKEKNVTAPIPSYPVIIWSAPDIVLGAVKQEKAPKASEGSGNINCLGGSPNSRRQLAGSF